MRNVRASLAEQRVERRVIELEEVGSQRAAAIAIDTPRYWAARLDDADSTVPQRVWVSEIGIGERADKKVIFGARLACVTRGEPTPFDRSVPNFVRQVVAHLEVSLDGRPIGRIPWLVTNDDEVDDLVALISDASRRCDVILFALPEHSTDPAETVASPLAVHRKTYGAAHVAVITGPASFRLSDRVGKEFSVFRQAVRTYRPGFDTAIDHPFRHPLGFPRSVAVWDNIGPEAYERLLISQALIRTVSSADIEEQLPPFSFVKRRAGELRIEAARGTGLPTAIFSNLRRRKFLAFEGLSTKKGKPVAGFSNLQRQNSTKRSAPSRTPAPYSIDLRLA